VRGGGGETRESRPRGRGEGRGGNEKGEGGGSRKGGKGWEGGKWERGGGGVKLILIVKGGDKKTSKLKVTTH
jgi:hypothetical protein